MSRFVAPLYVTPATEKGIRCFHVLNQKQLEILVNEKTKYAIKGDTDTENVKLIKEKTRNIVTKWFSQIQITEPEYILVLGPAETLMERLRKTMAPWIVSSSIDAYSTWTTMPRDETENRLKHVVRTSITFCTFSSGSSNTSEMARRDGEASETERITDSEIMSMDEPHVFGILSIVPKDNTKDMRNTDHKIVVPDEISEEKSSSDAHPGEMRELSKDEESIQLLDAYMRGLRIHGQKDSRGISTQDSSMIMKPHVSTNEENNSACLFCSCRKGRDTPEPRLMLHSAKLQELKREGKKFVAPLYVTPAMEKGIRYFHVLNQKQLEILVNEKTKYAIKGDTDTENVKLIKEKTRNIVTKWFSQIQITEPEYILVLGPAETLMERLRKTMAPWIVSSSIDAYSTWTTMPRDETENRLKHVVRTSITFCTFSSGSSNTSEMARRDGEASATERITDSEIMSMDEPHTKDMRNTDHKIVVPDEISEEKSSSDAHPGEMRELSKDEESIQLLDAYMRGLRIHGQKDSRGISTQDSSMIMKPHVSTNEENSCRKGRDTPEPRLMLHSAKLQELKREGKKFDHIFVFGVHALGRAGDSLWIDDVYDVHLGHVDGHFWIFTMDDKLPGNADKLLSTSSRKKVGRATEEIKQGRGLTWIHQAQEYIKRTYPDWENDKTTRLVPPVEDKREWVKVSKTPGENSKRQLILRLYQLGQRNKLPMFITYNRNFVHLIEKGDAEKNEGILERGVQDIVLIHCTLGAIFIQVKNLDTKETEKNRGEAVARNIKAAVARNIKTAREQLQKDVRSLKTAMRKSGLEDAKKFLCIRVIALPNVKRCEIKDSSPKDLSPSDHPVFLCEEEYQSAVALERWWQKRILPPNHQERSTVNSKVYLQLLAIYIAPVYALPAYAARRTKTKLNLFTKDKLGMLVNGPRKFVLKGAAGTGKTWLLQEKIRAIVGSWFSLGPIEDKDEKVLLVCWHRLLVDHFRENLFDLLLESAMAVLGKWVDSNDEKEKRRVRDILYKNIIICHLGVGMREIGSLAMEANNAKEEPGPRHDGSGSDKIREANLATRIVYASWEAFLFYELLRSAVAAPRPGEDERWQQKTKEIGSLFLDFTPSTAALNVLADKVGVMTSKEGLDFQLINRGSVSRSMLGISRRLFECLALVKELLSAKQYGVLEEEASSSMEDVRTIFQTEKPPFHHIFVDEAEDLCSNFEDHWSNSFRSLYEGTGFFWQAYDPLSLREIPVALKEEVEAAHTLYEVMRNPRYVMETWARDKTLWSEWDSTRSGSHHPKYAREEIRLGHDVMGPKVEKFHVSSRILDEKIQGILKDKFGCGAYVEDIAILFVAQKDFHVHGERLRREIGERLQKSFNTACVVVDEADSFKGLEAAIVFLIINKREKRGISFYLGASRCTSHLIQLVLETSEEEDAAAELELAKFIRQTFLHKVREKDKDALEVECRRLHFKE
ncbi:unnamed protein product [Darwinula stevensoni]|uniref:Uncharacterized protein n=1 Tax=Darwinula stevensoni TaxID=69355 RepID=A0A7R8XC75_9CRUS|nr:unnamed protein product [Darwinula stevensoni]CAG0891883.1 unnamed protein product [Darwinula stevensoni]